MPLRRNRWQYEQLTDFDRGPYNRPQKKVGRIDVSAATSTSSAIRETIKETTDRSWLEGRRPLRRFTTDPSQAVSTGFAARPEQLRCDRLETCIFGDESRFSLIDDDRDVWKRTGQRSDPAHLLSSGIQQFHKV
ncbi:hypothetical protein TNCV_4361881 [Trichonephila clavipes]|nr:hypothetical protein TNCV_4361881 [Trichonephila clavipes]